MSCTLRSLAKLWEGNVLVVCVSHSFCPETPMLPLPMLHWTSLHRIPPPPPNKFKQVSRDGHHMPLAGTPMSSGSGVEGVQCPRAT